MSDESKKVKMAGKVLESEMLQLQQNILDSDDQVYSQTQRQKKLAFAWDEYVKYDTHVY